MGSRHVATSPYHPETNGANERVNSTLLPYLRAFSEHDPDHWFEYLGAAQYAYNTSYQTSLAATPYFLLYGRDPVDSVDQTIDALVGEDTRLPTLDEWMTRLEVARHLAQQHLIAVQEANAERLNRSRHDADEIQEHSWVYLKPRQERKAKLDGFGLGLFQVVRRAGNVLDLRNEQGGEQRANISDVVLVRRPPPGYTVMDPYQVLRSLLHQHARISDPAPHALLAPDFDLSTTPVSPWDSSFDGDADSADSDVYQLEGGRFRPIPMVAVGSSDAERAAPAVPDKDKMEADEEMDPVILPQPAVSFTPKMAPPGQRLEPERRGRVANRISDVAVRDRLLYVKIGYQGEPDTEDDPTWFFFKDLAEPDKRQWLRHFVKRNVAGILDSGWKSLPKLLAESGAPLPSGQSVRP
jgi:hypothetical protein